MSAEAWAVIGPAGLIEYTIAPSPMEAWGKWCTLDRVSHYMSKGYRVERVTMLTESEQSARDAELAELRQMLLEAEEGIILRDAAAISLRLRTEKAERKLAEAERRGMERARGIVDAHINFDAVRVSSGEVIDIPRKENRILIKVKDAIRAAADQPDGPSPDYADHEYKVWKGPKND